MRKEMYIQVPEPCHEDWNAMTPVEQGRYCQSCCKEVVDFSVMSDLQVMEFLSKPRGRTCGNFAQDQLNRIITAPASPPKRKFWVVMFSFLLPLFAIKGKAQFRKVSSSQQKNITDPSPATLRGDTVVNASATAIKGKVTDKNGQPIPGVAITIKGSSTPAYTNKKGEYICYAQATDTLVASCGGYINSEIILNESSTLNPVNFTLQFSKTFTLGKIAFRERDPETTACGIKPPARITVTGKVTDKDGNPIPGAVVNWKDDAKKATVTNDDGEYSLMLPNHSQPTITLQVSMLGYVKKDTTLQPVAAEVIQQDVVLEPYIKKLDDVVIQSTYSVRISGGIWCGVRIKKNVLDTMATKITDLIRPADIKVYPNPVSTKQFVQIELKEKGNYALQLLNLQGQVMQRTSFTTPGKKMAYQLELPATLAAGTYVIQVTDINHKKQYSEKLIVQ